MFFASGGSHAVSLFAVEGKKRLLVTFLIIWPHIPALAMTSPTPRVESLFTNGRAGKRLARDVFDAFATHSGRVRDVIGTNCFEGNSSISYCLVVFYFAVIIRRSL